jgi:hypothetical protein
MKYIMVVEDGAFSTIHETESEEEVAFLMGKAVIYRRPDWWEAFDKGFWIFASRALGGIPVDEAKARLLRERAEIVAGIE